MATTLVDHRTFVIAGDGDLMEGVNHEAVGLAGHLKLGRLIVLWDDNRNHHRRLDRAVAQRGRRRAPRGDWAGTSIECDGLDGDEVDRAIDEAMADPRPSLIRCKTIIGYGAPNKQGTSATHGAALGQGRGRSARGPSLGSRRWNSPFPTMCWRRGARPASAARRCAPNGSAGSTPAEARPNFLARHRWARPSDELAQAACRGAARRSQARGHPQGVRNGAGGDQPGDPRDHRRIGRSDRVEQHQDQEPAAADRRQLRRALHLLRHPRVRHGGGDERHGAARRRHSLRRHLPGLHRLLPPGDPPVARCSRRGSSTS